MSESKIGLKEALPEDDPFALQDEEPFELPRSNAEATIALLNSWLEDKSDAAEQRETLEYLKSRGIC